MIFVLFDCFLGVLKPGHRCARIDDLASDVYSAIEYIYFEKVRLDLVRPLHRYEQANMHSHKHKKCYNVIKHAHSRVFPCRHTHTRMQAK